MADVDHVPMDSEYMDYPEHERTYRLFITLFKRGGIAVVVLMVLMAIFLV